jgi:outer membrane biosynthesis protein TonB
MRVGLTVSLIGHAMILGFGFVSLPDTKPFAPDLVEALPVDLVDIADVRDLMEGDKRAKDLPAEKPQPKPQVKAEAPAPPQADEPAPKPVEAARPPEPRPVVVEIPEPEPEPEPAPREVAALPVPPAPELPPPPEPAPLAEAEPLPAPQPVEPRMPRKRPEPPRQMAERTPEPPKPPERQVVDVPAQETPKQEFRSDDIAALLDKQQPAGGGDPAPVEAPQTLGSIDGRADAAMTQSEIDALKARIYSCWNPPIAVREAGSLIVTVMINLTPDGALAGSPQVLDAGFSPLSTVAAEAAVRAVIQCAPFGDILRPEKYALWQSIEFVFDPRQMLGG